MINEPFIIINFKTYSESTAQAGLCLAQASEKVANENNAEVILCPQLVDLKEIIQKTKLKVFSQHVDAIQVGANTGWILPESVQKAQAFGSLVNHAEHKIDLEKIKFIITRLRALNLVSVVCCKDEQEALQVKELCPDFIAYEPPELIGGNVSVSTAKPEIIAEIVKKCKPLPVICGAGVKNSIDVKKAIQLGCKGVLVASGVIKALNQERAVRELVRGLK